MCESSGNFRNNDTGRNGHFGGFQFSPATWRSVGGVGSPANASIAEQLKRAKILLARSGPGQWECKVGLTKANGAAQGLTVLGGTRAPAAKPKAATAPASAAAGRAVAFAKAQLGKPYIFGAEGPNSFDCSGLTQSAWKAAGISIPRVAADQWRAMVNISPALIRPGDLVVYKGGGHIAIYIGGGKIIEAPRPGKTVQTAPFRSGWYADNFTAVVRPAGLPGQAVQPKAPAAKPKVTKPKVTKPKAQVPVPGAVAKPGTYKIKAGDWLSKIAAAHNVAGGWRALFDLNSGVLGDDPDLVFPGQLIKLK
jgi:cell wall-associated NlpC family hydrolase